MIAPCELWRLGPERCKIGLEYRIQQAGSFDPGSADGIRLSITKQQVQDLPPVDIDHPGG